ncbi:MAG: hypothetical protein MUF27_11825 [Acidobacteria bacterium]|nr:hypothetical protein [Acidobacteriota bacterium]
MSAGSRATAARFVDRRGGSALLWVLALAATLATAAYQRLTGPTHPVRVKTEIGGAPVSGKLPRSHGGEGGAIVSLVVPDPAVTGELAWRRFPTDDPWIDVPLLRLGEELAAELPHQPAAGKLEYGLRLARGRETRVIQQDDGPIVIRFRGDVPAAVLLPHVIWMFLALVIGIRALFGALAGERDLKRHLPWLLAFLVPGGLILGPIVQKYAFDAYWTGWPFGEDLTDNKTLASVLAWAAAWLIARRWPGRPAWHRLAVLAAAAVMIAVYLIPHSARGSQLDWSKMPPPPAAAAGIAAPGTAP